MRYRYVLVAEIRGLMPPAGTEMVIDVPRVSGTITYTANRDSIPEVVDTRAAISSLMMRGLAGKFVEDPGAARRRKVLEIRHARRAANSPNMLVILDINSVTEDFELIHTREEDEFIVSFGESPAKSIRGSHERYVQSLFTALSLSAPTDLAAKRLVDCILFYRDDGKPIFCYEMEGYGTAYTVAPMTQKVAEEAHTFAAQLSKGPDYADVNRLLAKSMDLANDELLSFLSAWAALEIFVSKSFKEYEKLLFKYSGAGRLAAHPDVLQRISTVMSDKFRLTDKFAMLAGTLDEAGVETDLKTFGDVKGLRDRLFHGKEISTKTLPCESTRNLVRKYLRLHLEAGSAR